MSKHLSIQLSKQLNRSIEQVSACCFTHLFLIKQLNASAEQTSAYEVNEQVSSCYSDTCSWDHNPQCRITDHLSVVIQRFRLRMPETPQYHLTQYISVSQVYKEYIIKLQAQTSHQLDVKEQVMYSDTFGPIAWFNPVMGYTIRPCNPSAADQNTYKELGDTLLLYRLAISRSHLVILFSPYSTPYHRI